MTNHFFVSNINAVNAASSSITIENAKRLDACFTIDAADLVAASTDKKIRIVFPISSSNNPNAAVKDSKALFTEEDWNKVALVAIGASNNAVQLDVVPDSLGAYLITFNTTVPDKIVLQLQQKNTSNPINNIVYTSDSVTPNISCTIAIPVVYEIKALKKKVVS
jgi:hypothetical protein